jgi:hypothetical protein
MKRFAALVFLSFMLVVGVASAGVTNGGFESESFAGWAVDSWGSGDWFINDGSDLSLSDFESPAPAQGSFDAAWDMTGPSAGVIYQDTVVPSGGQLMFSFAYYNDAEEWVITEDSEFDTSEDNQWLSFDVLRAGRDPTTFDPADILKTAVRITSSGPYSSGWQNVQVDLSGLAGKTVRLRFAAANTVFFFPVWLDNVRIVGEANVQHIGYCSVSGNTWPNGDPIPPGTFLQLITDQPKNDFHYTGAQPAIFVQGMGITCDSPPAGYVQQGYATDDMHVPGGVYPLYVPGA